ncbi:VOC family protein [Nocardia lasii]|uniref:VOC family protein n=1 Tax=Nocardia lasii TaxID=1616107 RepID=A0ABW1JPN8_9NOCA
MSSEDAVVMDGIAQVKLPVTDVVRSARWYGRLLGVRLWTEVVEDGVLRGAGLMDPGGRYNIALRDRRVCAGSPDLTGFDVLAFRPRTRADLEAIADRCDRLGIARGEIETTGAGARLDVPDPDGTVVRFYQFELPTTDFLGVEFANGVEIGFYATPRIDH